MKKDRLIPAGEWSTILLADEKKQDESYKKEMFLNAKIILLIMICVVVFCYLQQQGVI